MVRNKPRICATVIENDPKAVKAVESLVDLFEVRIDLIGRGWPELAAHLGKPWIACNRSAAEGGSWQGNDSGRIAELLKAVKLGASIIDLELGTPGVADIVKKIKGKADCLLSYHDLEGTPPPEKMRQIVRDQVTAGADICKLVTTAQSFADNLALLQLIADFPESRLVAFAMGDAGTTSRVLCPLVGGYFTYASIKRGRESAPGQISVKELSRIYGMLKYGR